MIETTAEKLERLCQSLGLSLYKICAESGVSYKTLDGQLKHGRSIPLETIDAICGRFGVPIGFFSKHSPSLGIAPESDADKLSKAAANLIDEAMQAAHMQALRRRSEIGTLDVLDWLDRTNSQLEDFDALRDSVDLFHVMGAEDNVPKPFRIGRNSLSTQQFSIEDEAHYSKKIGEFHPALLENIKKGRIEASYRPYMLATVEIRAMVGGKWITEKYRRLTAKVFLPNNQELTLVHAVLTPNNRQSNHVSTGLDLIQPQASLANAPQE